MSLTDRLPPTFPLRARLAACERELQRTERGAQVLENFEASLERGLLTATQFARLCARLGELIPDPPATCNSETLMGQIDTPEPFYCQGPRLPSNPGHELSRVMELWVFLFATLGRPPTDSEYEDALQRWRQGIAGTHYSASFRGKRPFFWVTPTECLLSAAADTPDRLRDLLGLDIPKGFLLEARFSTPPDRGLHRPTVLDALDNPTFYPAVGQDGWGITDDLNGPRPTPGVPEAVTPEMEVECEVIGRGELIPSLRPRGFRHGL
jgi:hypothetical protein